MDLNNIKKKFEKDGYIIIKNAITNPEKELEILKKDTRVHSNQMWNLRLKVKHIFSKFINSNNLVCSFDGNCIGNCDNIDWHVDQNQSHQTDVFSIQGVLALKESNCTKFLKGSQKYFYSLSKRNTDSKNPTWEFYNIPDNDVIWKRGLEIVKPKLQKGDLLLFDSRIVHCVEKAKNRAVVYISMYSRNHLLNHVERIRKKAFLKGWSSTHWCERFIYRDYSGPIRKKIPKKYLNLI